MAEDAQVDTQEPAAVETTETAPEAPSDKKETVGQVMETVPKAPETVGLDKFLEIKKDNKQLRDDIASLKKSVEEGATKSEVSADINAIAKEYGIDEGFLSKFTAAIKAEASKEAEAKLAPLQERERQEKLDQTFAKHFKESLERMPEYEGIVNAEVIKALTLDPSNSHKTFDEIIEQAYGNAIQGKRTIETTTPGGGKSPDPIDFERAKKDPAYYNQLMANPTMKAEYNKDLEKRLRL